MFLSNFPSMLLHFNFAQFNIQFLRQYLDLMRAVCALLEMEVPKRFGTITNMPQKERDKIIKERHKVRMSQNLKNLQFSACFGQIISLPRAKEHNK